MSIDILVHNTNIKGWERGDINSWTDQVDWSQVNRLPMWLTLRVTGVTADDAVEYTKPWLQKIDYSIVLNEPSYYQIRIEVDAALVSVGGLNKDFVAKNKQSMLGFLQQRYGATLVDHGAYYAIFDVPKPVDLPAAKGKINDFFQSVSANRVWYFTEAGMDWAMLNHVDGFLEVTKAQALTYLRSRIDD